jgi:SAM-dependent methyltransferase
MTDASRHDAWASGDSYDAYIGRWSRKIAPHFLDWLGAGAHLRWLDVGCGTGALSQMIMEHYDPKEVIGIDSSDSFREHARSLVSDSRVDFKAGDASELPLPDNTFDVSVSGLVRNFVPDPRKPLTEMMRVTVNAGTVAFYVWDYPGGGLELLRTFWNAAAALNPVAEELTEGNRFPWCDSSHLEKLALDSGLSEVHVGAVETDCNFRDFEDYWRPFTLGTGPAPGYYRSLAKADRELLRERLENELPRNADGSIPMRARAWAVRGQV